jgi:hypothetical protein
MDANDGNISLLAERRWSSVQGYKHLAPPEQEQVRQIYCYRSNGSAPSNGAYGLKPRCE